MQADSIDKKLRTPDLPHLYDTEEDELAKGAEFRELVENVVRGRKAPRTHPSTLTLAVTAAHIPRQLQSERKSARVIQRRLWHRHLQRILEAQRVHKKRRADWKRYQDSSVTYLQQHISNEDTVSLLREPPTKKMKVSGHV